MTTAHRLAGVAHDLRNVVLFPLGARVELARRALHAGNSEKVDLLLQEMTDVIAHGTLVLARLIGDTGRAPGDRQSVDADELAIRAVDLVRARLELARSPQNPVPLADAGPEIVISVAAACSVRVAAEDVVAALVNLLVNAIEAIEAGRGTGRIEVRAWHDIAGVTYEVADDGPGLDPAIRDHMFDPCVTTKGRAGRGLGLAMVDACVRAHHGTIDFDSAPGRGTRFRIRFPL